MGCNYCGNDFGYSEIRYYTGGTQDVVKKSTSLPFVCNFCGGSFCVEHRLPENHKCDGLTKWKEKNWNEVSENLIISLAALKGTCTNCGKVVVQPFICHYCENTYCFDHHLPERHSCIGLLDREKVREMRAKICGTPSSKPIEMAIRKKTEVPTYIITAKAKKFDRRNTGTVGYAIPQNIYINSILGFIGSLLFVTGIVFTIGNLDSIFHPLFSVGIILITIGWLFLHTFGETKNR